MEDYFRGWQENYHQYPYSERYEHTLERYAPMMMDVFREAGILDDIKERKVRIVASSVSSGNKDIAFMRALDDHLDTLKQFHRPEVIFTDFAYEDPGPGKVGTPVMKMPKEPMRNIDLKAVTADMFHVPLETNSVDVLYERLGALWHAADRDDRSYQVLDDNPGEYTEKILDEYKRVVSPGGKVIIDLRRRFISATLSTAERVSGRYNGDEIKDYFEKLGFGVKFVGGEDYLLLTKQETDS